MLITSFFWLCVVSWCHLAAISHKLLLVFTKSVDSNFRAFWLAPVTRKIVGYSLFCERKEKWSVFSRKFQKKKLKKRFFIHLIWLILKQLSPSGSVKSGGYIPRRFASRCISTTIHTSPSGDSCILLLLQDGNLLFCFFSWFTCPNINQASL